ncbi:MAG: nuclear transport factor 2 family protein [Candidatus Sericytochromatia bacterium]
MSPTLSAEATVQAWIEAVNTGDLSRLLALSDPEIVLEGPRGPAQGHAVLGEWLARARVRFETLQVFSQSEQADGWVVLEQRARWFDPSGSVATGPAQQLASAFEVQQGRVLRVLRVPELDVALKRAGF